ncbi:transporter [Roseiconus nitratireducens]|uniref:Transporter n=2 Tax=Roseiconus nitratireducens TaxID=2605748 RepID=A0A5M6DMB3_9BACT|nr:transporter [Roseiconus nitratireducens]
MLPSANAQFLFLGSESSEEDEIETDRDSFTPSTTVVGEGRFVFESAYSFIDNRDVSETHSYPEIVGRYGISENIELRFGWNYEVGGAGNPISGNVPEEFEEGAGLERESRVLYGAKFFLAEQEGWMPESSVILQGYTPTSGEANDSSVSASYVFGWELANSWVWDSALRYSTGSLDEDDFNVWSPSTVIKIPIGERWKAHAEYFGVYTEGRESESSQYFFSPGIHYLVTPNFEVGTRVGWGLNNQAPNFFSNVGVGLRY